MATLHVTHTHLKQYVNLFDALVAALFAALVAALFAALVATLFAAHVYAHV